jgi:hypothetical protein
MLGTYLWKNEVCKTGQNTCIDPSLLFVLQGADEDAIVERNIKLMSLASSTLQRTKRFLFDLKFSTELTKGDMRRHVL